jgi:uncharacterized metal-binding protein
MNPPGAINQDRKEDLLALHKGDAQRLKIAKAAAQVEAKFYGAATRLEEIALLSPDPSD